MREDSEDKRNATLGEVRSTPETTQLSTLPRAPVGTPAHNTGETPPEMPTKAPDLRPRRRAHEQVLVQSAPPTDARLMTVAEVAAFLGVHVKTIHRWRRTLGLPCVLVGGRVRFFPSEVIRWVSARKEE